MLNITPPSSVATFPKKHEKCISASSTCLLSSLIPGPPLLIGLCLKLKNIWPQQLWTVVLVEANFSGSDFLKHYPTFCTLNLWGVFFTLFNHQMTATRSLEETHDPVQLCNVFLISYIGGLSAFGRLQLRHLSLPQIPLLFAGEGQVQTGTGGSPRLRTAPCLSPQLLNLRDGDVWQCNGQCVFHAALQCTCHFHNMVTVFALDKQFLQLVFICR